MATKAHKLAARGVASFEQAHGDLVEAARLFGEEADRQRVLARDAALASEAARTEAERNLERADRLAGFLSL